jgi:hypothetical protein
MVCSTMGSAEMHTARQWEVLQCTPLGSGKCCNAHCSARGGQLDVMQRRSLGVIRSHMLIKGKI